MINFSFIRAFISTIISNSFDMAEHSEIVKNKIWYNEWLFGWLTPRCIYILSSNMCEAVKLVNSWSCAFIIVWLWLDCCALNSPAFIAMCNTDILAILCMKSFQPGKTHMPFCYLFKETTLNGELSKTIEWHYKVAICCVPRINLGDGLDNVLDFSIWLAFG